MTTVNFPHLKTYDRHAQLLFRYSFPVNSLGHFLIPSLSIVLFSIFII